MTLEGKETENEEFWTKNYENKMIIKIKTIEKLKKKFQKNTTHEFGIFNSNLILS